ncbi:MAG: DUF1566 domain-containing protein [Deltaproteobacteria bacterium]|nr:DUF1566 domain-containing protein [Deltaproteobacteria bacterium]
MVNKYNNKMMFKLINKKVIISTSVLIFILVFYAPLSSSGPDRCVITLYDSNGDLIEPNSLSYRVFIKLYYINKTTGEKCIVKLQQRRASQHHEYQVSCLRAGPFDTGLDDVVTERNRRIPFRPEWTRSQQYGCDECLITLINEPRRRKERDKTPRREYEPSSRRQYTPPGSIRLSVDDGKYILRRNGYFAKRTPGTETDISNYDGDFHNDFNLKIINEDRVVIDNATGLMWHQSGSLIALVYEKAIQWVAGLNKRGYADFHDWRLPTLEEGASLLERTTSNGDLYIDPIFSEIQKMIWTSNPWKLPSGYPPNPDVECYWVIRFHDCTVWPFIPDWIHYSVRPVRSIR